MCGRFAQFNPDARRRFEISDRSPDLPFTYNAAPGRMIGTVVMREEREFSLMKWGLDTDWAREKKFSLINVRDDTIRDKHTFTGFLTTHRCIIPADGFYEWKAGASGKTPYFIRMKDGLTFAMAGLYHQRQDDGSLSCAVVTTGPNSLMEPIHNRMPVILPQALWNMWLDPAVKDKAALTALLAPYDTGLMEAWPVGRAVNNARNEGPELIKPAPGDTLI